MPWSRRQISREGDLRLDDEQDVKRDRDGERVVVAGDVASSNLFRRITSSDEDLRMPPPEAGSTLTQDQINVLRRWIEQGAPWGRHWALERIERPRTSGSGRHPIDVLIERRLADEDEAIQLNPIASRETRIRRVTLDLTGLPPTPEDIDRFLDDKSPDAWSRLVDRVLSSPAYGERLAWDWMELARYADSNGYQGDADRTMWPWRDWVANAFNRNLPFDQFTIWQLAGDLAPQATSEQILATAFNRNHMINGEGGRIPEENRVDYVLDMTETMGTAWLGLTLNCCRCHDHKFDPLTQREYYRLTAFFNQTPVDGGGGNPQTPPVFASPSPSQLQAAEALQRQIAVAEAKSEDAPGETKAAGEAEASDVERLRVRLEELRKAFPLVMVMRDRDELRKTFVLDRGLYNQPTVEVTAGVPEALPALPSGEAANRLGLARWLASREHPLTARVVVNRYWQMLFGVGLVETAQDFGVQGEYPFHRELLDWLAVEFMESGWDVKHLLRTIVASDAYQRSSQVASADAYRQDPKNRRLTRGPRFRMPSWMIRDQALAAAGLLNRQVGGRPVFPYQPAGVWAEATFGKNKYRQDTGANLYRRSLYVFWRRIVGPTMFFDSAKRQVCEVQPLRTNTPLHSLTTLNDTTYVEAARALAATTLISEAEETRRFARVYRAVLGRPPTIAELRVLRKSLERAREVFLGDVDAASQFLSHGEYQASADLPPGELAAWTSVCLNVLNLDETLTSE